MLLSRLSPSCSNRWVHFDTVSRRIFGDIQETQFSGSENGSPRSSQKCFPGGIGNRRITFGYNPWVASPATPQHVPRSRNSQKWRLFRNLHNTEQQENPVPPNVGKKEGQGKGKKIEEK